MAGELASDNEPRRRIGARDQAQHDLFELRKLRTRMILPGNEMVRRDAQQDPLRLGAFGGPERAEERQGGVFLMQHVYAAH